jgi:hypothetical protein
MAPRQPLVFVGLVRVGVFHDQFCDAGAARSPIILVEPEPLRDAVAYHGFVYRQIGATSGQLANGTCPAHLRDQGGITQ